MSREPFAHDADHEHPYATTYRIPLVGSLHPWWSYEVAVVLTPEHEIENLRGVLPSEDEARIIGAYIDYRREFYDAWYRKQMLSRPFDVDGGTNSVILINREKAGWAYRKSTWTSGPLVWPMPRSLQPDAPQYEDTAGLLVLLDHINADSRRWQEFKTTRPEMSGPRVPASTTQTPGESS